ncbi:hypothetical protein [Aeromonas salmonicida]|uniref:hypothetical protein n=1 Tax=Aeromonas salmonicida TaxID=645 RepID=UPI003D32425E
MKLISKNWFYSLCDNGEHLILKVAYCNGAVDFTRNFKFHKDEVTLDEKSLDELAKDIIDKYYDYKLRKVFI